jgi:phage host-nuclease inhibitor protein Gam
MTAKVTRLKTPAKADIPQSRDGCAAAIRTLGDVMRDTERAKAAMNDEIGLITLKHQAQLQALADRQKVLTDGIEVWCSAHRAELTNDKLKSANLVTGEVGWRKRPPSVKIARGMEPEVIATLEKLGLHDMVRRTKQVNKDAVLSKPDEVRGLSHISIVSDVEDFYVAPFEVEAPEAA